MATDELNFVSNGVQFALQVTFAGSATSGAVTGIDGFVGADTVTGLSTYFGGDNTISSTSPYVDYEGLSFTTASGDAINFFYAGSTYEVVDTNFEFHYSTASDVTLNPVCYCRGTHILTPAGEVKVETLRPGDLVTTVSGAHRKLRWVGFGRTLVTPRNRDRATPVVVRRHALGTFVPRHDLYITRGHSLYLDGVLIPVEELINHRSIAWVDEARVVEYYHLELDSHDVLLAEGVAAESYREDGNSPQFQNVATRPETPAMPPYAPVLHDHPTVKRIWRELNERAGRPDLELTDDPDLHLLADGRRLDAEEIEAEVWRFRLPRRVSDLRIVSRSAIPSMLGIAQDQRRLGIAVQQIVLTQPGLRLEVGWEEGSLIAGFHGPEQAQRHRWTDGNAALPKALLPPLRAGATVELHLGGQLRYPVADAAVLANAAALAA